MGERLNLMVDEGISDLLTQLAGGERRRGAYLSDVIRGLASTTASPGADALTMTFALKGMGSSVAGLEARLSRVENQLAVMIAETRA